MKKISFKRIAIGLFFCGSLVFLLFCLVKWAINPAFPALWLSDEEKCAEETSNQPYISEGYYNLYFENCLMRYSGEYENIIDESSTIVPPEIYVEGVG